MQSNYLVFLYFGTIITPAILLAAFYAHIYRVVLKQLRHIVTMNPEKGSSTKSTSSGGTMVRVLGVHQTNEVKATQNLSIIVLFFMICWFPLYTINCILAFNPNFYVNSNVMLCSIILSHLNSAGNPLLYAYHLKDFRAALKNFFLTLFNKSQYCEPINRNNYTQYKFKLQNRASSISTCNLTNARNKTKLIVPDKISTIVKTSAVVAAATTGEMNRTIWNIAEHSESSSDSSKSLDSCNHEKSLIRPATPYRPRIMSELNSSYKMCLDDESDNGFNEEETLPYRDYELETSLGSRLGTPEKLPPGYKRHLSNSSPQLSRGLYFVESDSENYKTVSSLRNEPKNNASDSSPKKTSNFKLSTLQVVKLFKKPLNRSLSDSGHGVVNSCAR
ncbi:hypothetical protein JTB14_006824 [Gonioctena quinquepunctata]|nr:hypothetical protein JTB14_006824 [Gonioctena quinquepunctata]